VQDFYFAIQRYCNHERGETPEARRVESMAASLIQDAMSGDHEAEQLIAEIMTRATRLDIVAERKK
jgi:hypothetical protein